LRGHDYPAHFCPSASEGSIGFLPRARRSTVYCRVSRSRAASRNRSRHSSRS
jgi:hypothetical protein